jgi:hypothetical protein
MKTGYRFPNLSQITPKLNGVIPGKSGNIYKCHQGRLCDNNHSE